jgi:CRP-like cAMP-binding protein
MSMRTDGGIAVMYSSSNNPNPTGRDARLAGYAPLTRTKPPRLTRGDRRDLLAQLRSYPVFAGCSADDLAALIKASDPCSLPPDWAIMSQGTPADFCYVILKGSAGVYRGGVRIAELGAGVLVGEMAALTGDLRSATVTTLTRVSALAIENGTLQTMLRKRPSLERAVRSQMIERTGATVRFEARTLPPRPDPVDS